MLKHDRNKVLVKDIVSELLKYNQEAEVTLYINNVHHEINISHLGVGEEEKAISKIVSFCNKEEFVDGKTSYAIAYDCIEDKKILTHMCFIAYDLSTPEKVETLRRSLVKEHSTHVQFGIFKKYN